MGFLDDLTNLMSLGDDQQPLYGAPPTAPGTLPNLEQFVGDVGGASGAMVREPSAIGGRAGPGYTAEFRSADAIRRDVARTFLQSVTGRDPRSATNRVRLSDGTLVDIDPKTMDVSEVQKVRTLQRGQTPGNLLAREGPTLPGKPDFAALPDQSAALLTNTMGPPSALTPEQIAEAKQTYAQRTAKLQQLTPTTLRLLEDATRESRTPKDMQQALADRLQLIQTFGPETVALRLAAAGTGADRKENLAKLLLHDQEQQAARKERESYRTEERTFRAQQREDEQAFRKEQLAATLGERTGKTQIKALTDKIEDWNRDQKNIIRVKFKDDPDKQAQALDLLESDYLTFRRKAENGDITPEMARRLRLTEEPSAASVKAPSKAASATPALDRLTAISGVSRDAILAAARNALGGVLQNLSSADLAGSAYNPKTGKPVAPSDYVYQSLERLLGDLTGAEVAVRTGLPNLSLTPTPDMLNEIGVAPEQLYRELVADELRKRTAKKK